jgi:hypothetical protein
MSKEIEDLKHLIEDLMGVDFITGPKNIEKEIVEYLDKYYHILTQEICGTTSLVKEMQDLVEDFVDADYCYNGDRWDTVVNCAKDADAMESNWKHLYPYDFVNTVMA